MQNFSLFFLLLVTASMSFTFGVPAIAQESTETPVDENMMGDTMTEEMTDDELADDTMMEDAMEETMTEVVESPLKQLMAGTDPHEIQCKAGQKLVFKASNWRPVCINESSHDVLLSRGWISSHDPSHEDLMKMMEDIPQQPSEEEPDTGEIEIEEDVVVEEEPIPGNETEAEPQSYTVELREDMEMGAQ